MVVELSKVLEWTQFIHILVKLQFLERHSGLTTCLYNLIDKPIIAGQRLALNVGEMIEHKNGANWIFLTFADDYLAVVT